MCEKYQEDGYNWNINPLEHFKYLLDGNSTLEHQVLCLENYKLKNELNICIKKIEKLEFLVYFNDIIVKSN